MSHELANLRDCSRFRQTLLAKPPVFVHGTAILLGVLLMTALVWANLTEANLVVLAPGRVRPEHRIFRVFVPEGVDRPGYSVSGRVEAVLYREGQRVARGQVLLRLNTRLLDAEQARLELTLQTCRAELARLEDRMDLLSEQFEVALAKARVELLQAEEELRHASQKRAIELRRADAEYGHALLHLQRTETLHSKKAVTEARVEEARLNVRQARAMLDLARQPIPRRQVESRRRQVELVERNYALARKELEAEQSKEQAEYKRTSADQATVERQRQQAVLRSPIDGIITTREIKVGDILERGRPVVEIAEQGSLFFEATVSNRQASHLRQGMPVRVKLDAYDHQWYGTLPGKVVFISADSRIAAGDRGKPPGYEVRIALDRDHLRRGKLSAPVKLGLTGIAEIITERRSLFSILRKNIRRSISLG